MSRIGKQPLVLPAGVQASLKDATLTIKGPKGSLNLPVEPGITVTVNGNQVVFARNEDTKHLRAMHGTTRAMARNMADGVTKGYSKSLEVVGVGYKAVLAGKRVDLSVGHANILSVDIPEGITVTIPDPNHVTVTGMDKHMVGQVAANIRATRKPEPYKGKGVRYAGDVVRKKAGKAATTGGKK